MTHETIFDQENKQKGLDLKLGLTGIPNVDESVNNSESCGSELFMSGLVGYITTSATVCL